MRSLFEDRRWVLAASVLALVALTVLAVGLQEVSFRDAQPFLRRDVQPNGTGVPPPAEGLPSVPLQSQFIFWGALLLLVALIGVLLSPEMRKRMFRLFFRAAFTYWALYFIFTRYGDAISSLGMALTAPRQGGGAGAAEDGPPPVFEPPAESAWLSYAVAVFVVLLLAFLAWRFQKFWSTYAGRSDGRSLQEIAKIARSSLRDLTSGRESTDVIMNCYFRMTDVVADKRRLQRGAGMTPGEFALRLEQTGLPGEAVKRLTRLFENVRYGAHRSGPAEVNEAVACLTTILHYCGEPV